ncbi:Hsp33 family molecular chaperone HslO [Alicyclobacillaceae bacterium I2511]|nr:Hsp33 family molecular chaperone HslO [Alicyclobacillaceae bacterium I2511]
MQQRNLSVRGLSSNGHIRGLACVTTQLVNVLQLRHGTSPVASAALGRTASIAAMMALLLKDEERLTVQIHGNGPLGNIVVDADSQGNVRGYVDNPDVQLPSNRHGKLDVGRAVGSGLLYVTRDMGLNNVYRGSCELQTGEIGDDLTHYFTVSEQIPSAVGAGVLVNTDGSILAAGGFIVQLLPGYVEDEVSVLEDRVKGLPNVTELLRNNMDAQGLLQQLIPDVVVLDTRAVSFACTCSRERMSEVLHSLGRQELEKLVADQLGAEIRCHFCNQKYVFTQSELARMVEYERIE